MLDAFCRSAIIITFLAVLEGCETTSANKVGSFRFTGDGVEGRFQNWRATVPVSYRAQIDALAKDDTVLIHILRGRVLSNSRGAMSGRSYDPRVKSQCLFHPVADQVKPSRDWDVVLDFNQLMLMEKELGLPMPVEALLQHEIFGHVVPAMAGALDSEDNAIREENEYRKAVGLPLVPWSFGRK